MTLDEIEQAIMAVAGLKARQQGPEEEAAKERAMLAGAALVINIARSLETIAKAARSMDMHGGSR